MNEFVVYGASMIERQRIADLNRDCERRRQWEERAGVAQQRPGILLHVVGVLHLARRRHTAGGAAERPRMV